jgi:flavin reductase (DIM6/NTAB) family NADH-FMN oxidoreductase RutF
MAAEDYERVDPERASVWVPAPVILVAAAAGARRNVMVAVRLMRWDDPPRSSILVGVAKHSVTGELLRESGEFTVGILTEDQQPVLAAAREMVKASSREVDKFAGYGLQTLPATRVQAPLIDGCALNVECRLRHYLDVDDAYAAVIGDVVAMHARRDMRPLFLVNSQPFALPIELKPPST